MYPGFPENAQEMQKGQITLQEGWAKDALERQEDAEAAG